MKKIIRFIKLNTNAIPPEYQSENASGLDMHACLESTLSIGPGSYAAISTGIAVEIPTGFEGQIRPRSGLALKYGVTVLNSPGTIDSDYRGEIKILLINLGKEPFTVKHGDRIAQMVIAPVVRAEPKLTENLSETKRNTGGFGHTGI